MPDKSITYRLLGQDQSAGETLRATAREVETFDELIKGSGGKIEITADTTKVTAEVRGVQEQIAKLQAKSLKIDLDKAVIDRQLQALKIELEASVGERRVKITGDMTLLEEKLRALDAQKATINIDTTRAQASLARLAEEEDAVQAAGQHSGSGMDVLKGALGTVSIAAGAVIGALVMVSKVLDDSVRMGMAHANAEVALGADAFKTLSDQADKSANSMGQTTSEFINTGGQVAILAKNMGFSSQEAAKFGSQLPIVADHLATLSSGALTSASASDVLRSALAGEYDPLQSIGIAISQSLVDQERANVIKGDGAKLTTLQANALSVLNIVQRQTTNATEVAATAEGQHAQAIETSKARMSELWNTIEREALPALGQEADGLNNVINAFGSSAAASNTYNASMHLMGTTTDDFGMKLRSLYSLIPGFDTLEQKMRGLDGPVFEAAYADTSLASASDAAKAAMDKQTVATQALTAANVQAASAVLAGRDADRAYQQAVADATAMLSHHKAGLDITTAAGRANQAAIDGVASATLRQYDSLVKVSGGQAQADAALAAGRAELVKLAQQFGLTSAQAQTLATKIIGIPAAKATTITTPGMMTGIGLAQQLKSAIDSLHDKTIRIGINTVRTTTGSNAPGGGVGFAAGGPIPGAPSTVDNMMLPMASGEYVIDAEKTQEYRPLLDAIQYGRAGSGWASAAPVTSGGGAGNGGSTFITVNVTNAVVGNEQHLTQVITDALRRSADRGYGSS